MSQEIQITEEQLQEYFSKMAEVRGMPGLHQRFRTEETLSSGIRIHIDVLDAGKGQPVLIFVPGTAIYSLCYAELFYEIGKHGYTIIGFDPRGHGRSGGERGDYTIKEIISDTQRVISWAIENFNSDISVMGSSQGGIVAFYLAAIEDRIKSVICQNFADLTDPNLIEFTSNPRFLKIARPILTSVFDYLPQMNIPIATYLDLEKIPVKYFGTARNFLEQDPLTLKTISLRALRSLASTALPIPPEEIKTPVMVITGTNDSIFPVGYTQSLFDRLTCKKRLQLYEGLDHAMLTENVAEVVPPLLEWLQDIHGE